MIDELFRCRTRHTEGLDPSVQTDEQLGAIPGAETMLSDSVPESLGARWSTEESTAAAIGVGGGERLATTVVDATEMPRTTARAAKSSEAIAGAADVMPKSETHRLAASEEQAACPEMSQGVVGRSVWPPSP